MSKSQTHRSPVSDYRFSGFIYRSELRLLESKTGESRLDQQTGDLLSYFLRHPNQLIAKDALIKEIWGTRVVTDHSVTVAISKLRKLLGESSSDSKIIQTVPKAGYQFIVTVETDVPFKRHSVSPLGKYGYAITLLALLVLLLGSFLVHQRNYEKKTHLVIQQAEYIWQAKDTDAMANIVALLEETKFDGDSQEQATGLLARMYSYKYSRYLGLNDDELVEKTRGYIETLPVDSLDYQVAAGAFAFYYQHDIQKAEPLLLKGQSNHRDNLDILLILANLYSATGRHQQAIQVADQAASLAPTSQLYLWEQIWTRYMSGDAIAAYQKYEQVSQFAENDEVPLAFIRLLQGDYPAAFEQFISALQQGHPQQYADLQQLYQNGLGNTYQSAFSALIQYCQENEIDVTPDIMAVWYLLAGQSDAAYDLLLGQTGLQQQTHLLWLHENPFFKRYLSSAQLQAIKENIWGS